MKNTYYILIREQATDLVSVYDILGVFKNKKNAEDALKKEVEPNIRNFANENNYTIYADHPECFDAGEDGEYGEEHISVYIKRCVTEE